MANGMNEGGTMRAALHALVLAAALSLAACGGGGGGSGGGTPPPAASTPTSPETLAGRCAASRSGINPQTGRAFTDRLGAVGDEKDWLRRWIDDTYLWYDEVPTNLVASSYATPVAYFADLKTPALTASGRAKDRFHYTYDTAAYQSLLQSTESGYGIEFAFVNRAPPRSIRVAYTEPGSPAALAGIARGDTLLSIDGIDAVNAGAQADIDALNAALSPDANGKAHAFQLRSNDGGLRAVNLTSAAIARSPVQSVRTIETPSGRVGYLQFNDHVAKAESQLMAAFEQFRTAGVTDLVLDMRYNGGGLLAIASELAAMIASPTATQGAAFEKLVFNRKNPFGYTATQSTLPFFTTARGFSVPTGQALPNLRLSRVTVLSGPDTCSASESVVNGLRGVGVSVDLIGADTCGKPYGFYPQDNCGTTYFSIQFQGVNARGFGDYGDGLAPTCTVTDDFEHALGDVNEGRLAAALTYRSTGMCPAVPDGAAGRRSAVPASVPLPVAESPYLDRPELRSNRLVQPADFSP